VQIIQIYKVIYFCITKQVGIRRTSTNYVNMKRKPSQLSIISNGSTNNGDVPSMSPVSPYPPGDRRYSTDLSPSEKQLFQGQEKHKTKFQRYIYIYIDI